MAEVRHWHAMGAEEALEALGTTIKGLSEAEAKKRGEKYGLNEIALKESVSPARIFISQFTSAMVLILIASAVVLIFLSYYSGDSGQLVDAGLIIFIVLVNGIFSFFQDYKAERSMLALKKMAAVSAVVMRDGVEKMLDSKELVPGDILLLEQGAKVPADARIISQNVVRANESILTGESHDVHKQAAACKKDAQLYERASMLFMGTIITQGTANAVVVSTGLETEIGRISKEVHEAGEQPTIFQRQLEDLGRKLGYFILAIIAVIWVVQFLFHVADPVTLFITSVALAVAAIPEGLPAVVTLSLALGTSAMLAKHALVRKLPVVESLGAVDVICTDKTGTLTEDVMTIRKIFCNGAFYEVTGSGLEESGRFLRQGKDAAGELVGILRAGVLCNNAHSGDGYFGQAAEVALLVAGKKAGLEKQRLQESAPRLREVPFSSERKRMTTVNDFGGRHVVFMKGAPEVVIERCGFFYSGGKNVALAAAKRKELLSMAEEMAKEALFVLAFATKDPAGKEDGDVESGLTFLGFQGMIDPPRKEVKEAVGVCKDAGIRIVMITGDSPTTAVAIAKQIGIGTSIMTGAELNGISEQDLCKAVESVDIFARVSPSHKTAILNALKGNGHTVAMTGDGVNDAPALKSADIGVAMGLRGTDVAREASDMVLLDDNFATIVEAVRQGRTIFANIRKFVNYLLTCNFAEVFTVFFASLFGYLPVTAVQLLWINFVTDGLPALALGADPSAGNTMKQKPRPKSENVINRRMEYLIGIIGAKKTVMMLLVFAIGLWMGGIAVAQTMAFTGFVLYEFVRIAVIRSQEELDMLSNKLLLAAVGGSIILQLIIIYSPLNSLFGVVPLGLASWAVLLAGVAIGYAIAMWLTAWVVRLTPGDS